LGVQRTIELVKLTAKVKLAATEEQAQALLYTLSAANQCCDWISEQTWATQRFRQFDIHRAVYREARGKFALSAQVVVRCIAKVADSYKLDRKAMRTFRPTGAIAYDTRILTWHMNQRSVSIWSVSGRLQIPFLAGERQLELLATQQGESDLIFRDGEFYLAATCEIAEPICRADGFLGVDLGVANIASDSDGKRYSGSEVKSVRHRQRRLRRKLQAKHTTSANRRLKKLAGKEARFARHVNHVVSKQIVARAEGTGRGIATEELGGFRERVKVGRGQRAVLHSWAFSQLRLFLEYKARLAGVPLVAVDPRNSSRECSLCHHISKSNRPNQSTFRCQACGHQAHADSNAASVLAGRAACKPATRGSRLSADRPAKLPVFSR
jgi:putative transposase